MEEARKFFADIAKERRRKKTPKGIRKSREIGGGKTIQYVDRPEYQKWLDDNFPGWSVIVNNIWTDSASFAGKSFPITYNVSIQLMVNDHGIMRQVAGVGTATVSVKEIERDNTALMKMKYSIALTDAIKTGCNWLGAFFDLRVDEEARERESAPTSDAQNKQFEEIIKDIPENHREVTKGIWAKQTLASGDKFLYDLKQKTEALKSTMKTM